MHDFIKGIGCGGGVFLHFDNTTPLISGALTLTIRPVSADKGRPSSYSICFLSLAACLLLLSVLVLASW